jgi:murein DD-endopeptidase MepM/ murein hydrolase activator NlpD
MYAISALQRARDAGGGALRQAYLQHAQHHIACLDPARHAGLIQQLQASVLALQGRGRNTKIIHVTPGEVVIPRHLQTPGVLTALTNGAANAGIDPSVLRVASGRNSRNWHTGLQEFDEDAVDEASDDETGDLGNSSADGGSDDQIAADPNAPQQPLYDPATGISCPVLEPRVTSFFGETKNRDAPHEGVDFHNPLASPVFATEDGVVKTVAPNSQGGNQIFIQNDSGGVSG